MAVSLVATGCSAAIPPGHTKLSYFADPSGTLDAAPGLVAAANNAAENYAFSPPLKQVYIDPGTYRIKSTADLSGLNVQLVGAGGTLVPALGVNGGRVIKSSAGVLELVGVQFDGGIEQPKKATGTTWIVFLGGDPKISMQRARIENCTFRNCNASDGTLGVNGAKVTHVIYASRLSQLDLASNTVADCSGAAVFLNSVASFVSHGNRWIGTDWYSFNIASDSSGTIDGDIFNSTKSTGVYWGGAINTVNAKGREPNRNIVVRNCTFSGFYSYGAIIRLQSDDGVTVEGNSFVGCKRGSLGHGPLGGLSCIRLSTWNPRGLRPSATAQNIRIASNKALGGLEGGIYRAFIYLDNTSGRVARNIEIDANICRSPDPDHGFTTGILVNGRDSGFDTVALLDNDFEVYLTDAPLSGGIVLTGNQRGPISGVTMAGNRVKNLSARRRPCYQIGVSVRGIRVPRPNEAING